MPRTRTSGIATGRVGRSWAWGGAVPKIPGWYMSPFNMSAVSSSGGLRLGLESHCSFELQKDQD